MIRRAAHRAWAEVCWVATGVGYAVRPYDMLADARRWFWQPRARCGWPAGISRSTVDDVVAATRRLSASRDPSRSGGSDALDPSRLDGPAQG